MIGGLTAGIYLALVPRLGSALEPFTRFLFALPKIALIPLFTLWFGLTLRERVAVTAIVVFFFVFYAVYAGIRSMPRSMDRHAAADGRQPFAAHCDTLSSGEHRLDVFGSANSCPVRFRCNG